MESIKFNLFGLILAFFLFVAVSILVSQIFGFFWRNSLAILLISAAFSVLLFKKFNLGSINITLPKLVYFLILLMLVLASMPLINKPFYPATQDPAQTILLRTLKGNIPLDFQPYEKISFSYQYGFHLFVRLFVDFIPFIPDYLIMWFFGILFAAMQVVLVYLLSSVFFKDNKIALLSALLLIGTKLIYANVWYGMYPWVLATCFFMLMVIFLKLNNGLAKLFLPVIIITHPGVGFYATLFLIIYFIFFEIKLKEIAKFIFPIIITIPSLIMIYSPLFINFLSILTGNLIYHGEIKNISLLFDLIISTPGTLGVIPSIFLFIAAVVWLRNKNYFAKNSQNFFFLLAIVSWVFSTVLGYFVNFIGNKIFELFTISAIIFAPSILAPYLNKINLRKFLAILVIVLLLQMFFFYNAKYLSHLRQGSKITKEMADFAINFKNFDPSLETAFFLTNSPSKIAEYSNKIPYDTKVGWFLPNDEIQIFHDEGKKIMDKKHEIAKKILDSNCFECIPNLGVKYAVVDKRLWLNTFDKNLLVFADGNFEVYGFG